MNGIMASAWLRDIPAGSDQDILMAELKNNPFCLKGAYLDISLGIGYTYRFAYMGQGTTQLQVNSLFAEVPPWLSLSFPKSCD